MTKHLSAPLIVLALVVLSVLALAACGGGDSSSASTTTSNTSKSSSTMTVTIKESHGDSGDVYAFDQTAIQLKKGDTITIVNQSDELQDIDGGDASKAGVDVKIPVNQSGTATFNIVGTFTLKSEKGATITVTVQ